MGQLHSFPSMPGAGTLVGGKYLLLQKLSEGGSGVVWNAKDPDGKLVALKFLKWSPLKSKQDTANHFKREFGILKSLSHPHIGNIYDFGIDNDSALYFFTTELFTNGDLRKLRDAPIASIERALLQTLRALEYLRNQGLLHLDLKPQNILVRKLGKNPDVALIDFGLATFRPSDRPGGTPNYMPPEVIVRRLPDVSPQKFWPAPDHRSDLYSLGITFYYLLTGVLPFQQKTEIGAIDSKATMRAHFNVTPPPPSQIRPEIPAYLDRIILKLMAHHPDDRYPTASVAAQAIQFRSPRRHSPETRETLLAYLPKEGKLIGRHAEQTLADNLLSSVAEGKPHAPPLLIILGKHGTGKSRFLSSLKPHAQQLEMEVTLLNAADEHHVSHIDHLLESTEKTCTHTLLLDLLEALFTSETATNPLREGLHHLIRHLQLQQRIADKEGKRYFLALTLNPEIISWDEIRRTFELHESQYTLLDLKNFTHEEMTEYLKTLLGEIPDPRIIESLRDVTEGNPLFVTEHLEQMISQGKLFTLAGRPDAETLNMLDLNFKHAGPSPSLKESLLQKIRELPEEAQKIAELLACFHRPAALDELEACAPFMNAGRLFLKLVEKGFVTRNREAKYFFSNSMTGRILEDALPRPQKAELHDVIASFLKKQKASSHELDIHLAHASRWEERLNALHRLVDRALEHNDSFMAIEHLQTILRELPQPAWKAEARTLILLGQTYLRSNQRQKALETFQRLHEIKAPPPLKQEFRIRSYEHICLLYLNALDLSKAQKMFEEALELLENDEKHLIWKVRLQNCLAAVSLRKGNATEAKERYEQTLHFADREFTKRERGAIHNSELGQALLASGNAKEAIPLLKKELENAQSVHHVERMANRHYLLGAAYRDRSVKKIKKATDHYFKGLELAKSHHLLDMQVRIHNELGNVSAERTDYTNAGVHYRKALQLAQQIESETVSVELMVNL